MCKKVFMAGSKSNISQYSTQNARRYGRKRMGFLKQPPLLRDTHPSNVYHQQQEERRWCNVVVGMRKTVPPMLLATFAFTLPVLLCHLCFLTRKPCIYFRCVVKYFFTYLVFSKKKLPVCNEWCFASCVCSTFVLLAQKCLMNSCQCHFTVDVDMDLLASVEDCMKWNGWGVCLNHQVISGWIRNALVWFGWILHETKQPSQLISFKFRGFMAGIMNVYIAIAYAHLTLGHKLL